jgi:tetratricopeptide (TPR) repeat protein
MNKFTSVPLALRLSNSFRSPRVFPRRAAVQFVHIVVVASFVVAHGVASGPAEAPIVALENAVLDSPENLHVGADYRQRIIETEQFDRSIRLLERLAAQAGSGPNVHISLALAYVDKVPVASPFKRIFLGRDAMRELTQAIAQEPSPLAYYVRGLVALFYPDAVFHRARGGIADLERAREMLTDLSPHPSHARVYASLGDGYWKIHDLPKAISIWTDGLQKFPRNLDLRARLTNRGSDLDRLIGRVLDPAFRVDTSLRELFDPVADP